MIYIYIYNNHKLTVIYSYKLIILTTEPPLKATQLSRSTVSCWQDCGSSLQWIIMIRMIQRDVGGDHLCQTRPSIDRGTPLT